MIRKMRKKDIKQTLEIWREAYQFAHPSISREDLFRRYNKMIEKHLPNAVKSSSGYVYEEDGEIRGFITFMPGRGTYIDNLYVKKMYRGKKEVGPALIEKAQEVQDNLTTDVAQENNIGIKFYKNHGFEKSHDRTSPEGEQKIRMIWKK